MRAAAPRPRFPDWPERLAALVHDRLGTPYQLGCHDCGLFAADAVLALTGHDPAAGVRGRYGTEEELAALVGAGGLEAFAAGLLADHPEVPPARAQRGDVVLLAWGNELLMGVVLGERIAAPALDGVRTVPASAARRAWVV